MKRYWLIAVGALALAGCTQQTNADIMAGMLGGSLGGPMGAVAGVSAVQPGWEWQALSQPSNNDPFADVAAQNRQQVDDMNWQTINTSIMQQSHVGLIPPD